MPPRTHTRTHSRAAAPGFLYVVKLREHVVSGERVFKVGRTCDIVARINAYPNGSSLLLCKQVEDTLTCEAAALRALRSTPGLVHRRDLGAEYFEGALDAVLAAVQDAAVPPDDAPASHVIWRARKLRPIRAPVLGGAAAAAGSKGGEVPTPKKGRRRRAVARARAVIARPPASLPAAAPPACTPPPAKLAAADTATSSSTARPRRCVDAIHAVLAVRRDAYEARGVVPVADVTADAVELARSLGWGCEARLTPAIVAAKVRALAGAKEVMGRSALAFTRCPHDQMTR